MSNFQKALTYIKPNEGGFVDNPHHEVQRVYLALKKAVSEAQTEASSIFTDPKNARKYMCSVDNCTRKAYAKGLCNGHYIRQRLGKNMDTPLRASKRYDVCAECGCLTGAKGGWGYCAKHYKQKRTGILKDAAINILGGCCQMCNQKFSRRVYDFHHRNRSEKSESPSAMFINKNLRSLAKELSKCTLLCANCHRKEHEHEQFW